MYTVLVENELVSFLSVNKLIQSLFIEMTDVKVDNIKLSVKKTL